MSSGLYKGYLPFQKLMSLKATCLYEFIFGAVPVHDNHFIMSSSVSMSRHVHVEMQISFYFSLIFTTMWVNRIVSMNCISFI